MRLHSLTLRNFRGVKDRTVELPAIGTTVVVGDNEVGKSSLVEAFDLVFAYPDDSKSKRILDIQPVGQDVAPEVTVELTLGTGELTYTKRWLKNRATELTILEPDGRRQSWTGREAHNEAERLFNEHVDPVLWQTLMVSQGQSLVLPTPADAEPLITAVTAESGTPVDGASMPLVLAVEHEYLRYWTRGGRPTGDFAQIGQDRRGRRAGGGPGVEGDGGSGRRHPPGRAARARSRRVEQPARRPPEVGRGAARTQAGDRRDPAAAGLGASAGRDRAGPVGEPHPDAGRARAAAGRGLAAHPDRRGAGRAAQGRRDGGEEGGPDRACGRGCVGGGRRAQGRTAWRRCMSPSGWLRS